MSTVQAIQTVTMAQGPIKPWDNDADEEDYVRDPKAFILQRTAEWVDNVDLFHNQVLVATYILPAYHIMPNGKKFFRSDRTLDESLWQGKVGLVLAKGPLAFVDAPEIGIFFKGKTVERGDWAWYDIHVGRPATIGRWHCRRLKDVEIAGRARDPNLIY